MFNRMLVIPPESIRACLYSQIETLDTSPIKESDFQRTSQILLHFETQTLLSKKEAAKHKDSSGDAQIKR